MSVSVVNGFLCFSSCDVAKARAGQDPRPKPDGAPSADAKPGAANDPAVLFGGALANRNAVQPTVASQTAQGAGPSPPGTSLDILV